MTLTADNIEDAWVPSDQEFSARLALVRNRMGWNQKEAALACGLPQSSWRHWEAQRSLPRNYTEVCKAISTRTGVSYEWLALGIKTGTGDQYASFNGPSIGVSHARLSAQRLIPRQATRSERVAA